MKAPLISIYIPTKNRLTLLKKAVDSVLNQTYTNWELIIVDDASTDGTNDYLKALSEKHDNITFLSNLKSEGACVARNRAIEKSEGSFVTGLDDDDTFMKDRLELFVDNYDDNYAFISSGWEVTPASFFSRLRSRLRYKYGVIDKNVIYDLNHIGNQVFVRKERVISLGGFDEKLTAWQDYDMWVRLIENYGPAYKLKHSTQLILSDNNLASISNSPKKVFGVKRFLSKHSNNMSSNQKKRVKKLIRIFS